MRVEKYGFSLWFWDHVTRRLPIQGAHDAVQLRINAVENSVNGHFLTPNGYLIGDKPSDVEVIAAHLPFGQFDGDFRQPRSNRS